MMQVIRWVKSMVLLLTSNISFKEKLSYQIHKLQKLATKIHATKIMKLPFLSPGYMQKLSYNPNLGQRKLEKVFLFVQVSFFLIERYNIINRDKYFA